MAVLAIVFTEICCKLKFCSNTKTKYQSQHYENKESNISLRVMAIMTVMPGISRTTDLWNVPLYSSVETMKIFVAMETINTIIRDPQFTANMVNTSHKTDNDSMVKKTRKKWA